MTETQARAAFNTAHTKLDTALAEYQRARQELFRITGQFQGADMSKAMKFNQAGTGGSAARVVADC